MTTSVSFNLSISETSAKWIMAGACFLGFCYVLAKYIENTPENEISLPKEAKDLATLPEVSPRSLADINFHQEVRDKARKAFMSGDYTGAVRAAIVGLYDVIRRVSNVQADGTHLIKLAFRGEKGTPPILKFVNLAPTHITNIDSGIIDLLEGFSKSIRKVHMHAEISITETQALQEISLACYLADKVENNTAFIG